MLYGVNLLVTCILLHSGFDFKLDYLEIHLFYSYMYIKNIVLLKNS